MNDNVMDSCIAQAFREWAATPPGGVVFKSNTINLIYDRARELSAHGGDGGGWRDASDLPPRKDGTCVSEQVLVRKGDRLWMDVAYFDWKKAEHDYMQGQFGDFKPRFYSGIEQWMPMADAIAALATQQPASGEVACFRVHGKLGAWGWVDGPPPDDVSDLIGDGDRIELAYTTPATAAHGGSDVLVPCPICGNEAVHCQDVLARTTIAHGVRGGDT